MRKTWKRLGSLALVLCMLLMLGPAQALASGEMEDADVFLYDYTFAELVNGSDGASDNDRSAERVDSEEGGVSVFASDGGSAAFEVGDSVSAKYLGTQVAVEVSSPGADSAAQASLSVGGDVTASSRSEGEAPDLPDTVAVNVYARTVSEGGASAYQGVGGSAVVSDHDDGYKNVIATQVFAESDGAGSAFSYGNVIGDISAEGIGMDHVYGAYMKARSNAEGDALALLDAGYGIAGEKIHVSAVLDGEEGGFAFGLKTVAEANGTGGAVAVASVNGDISAKSSYQAAGVEVCAAADGEAWSELLVNGQVSAEADDIATGAVLWSQTTQGSNDAFAYATIADGIVAKGVGGLETSANGIEMWVTPEGGTGDSSASMAVMRGGVSASAVEAESSEAFGIFAQIDNKGDGSASGDISVTGDVTATAGSLAEGVLVLADQGSLEVTVDGAITAEGAQAFGINTKYEKEWPEDYGINGEDGAFIVRADSISAVGGNDGARKDSATGVRLYAAHQGTFTAEIGKESAAGYRPALSASGANATGALLDGADKASATLFVTGDVNVTATDGMATGVEATAAEGSMVAVSVTGEIAAAAQKPTGPAYGLTAEADDAIVILSADGIRATGPASVGAVLSSNGTGEISLDVGGDLTGKAFGLIVAAYPDREAGKVDALVEGTLSGDLGTVVLGSADSAEGLSLTVWKAALNENEHVAETLGMDGGLSYDAAAEAFEKGINYIVMRHEPGAAYSVTREDGSALEVSHGKEIAHENEKLIVKCAEGFRMVGAYNLGDGLSALQQDEDGSYYVIVPKGGGLNIMAWLQHEGDYDDYAYAAPAATALLVVRDEEGLVTLRFYSDRSFSAERADGEKESGSFTLEDGQLVLVSQSGARMTLAEDGELVYSFADDADTLYRFRLSAEELTQLQNALA